MQHNHTSLGFKGKRDIIYDRPSERVPKQFFGLYVFCYNYKAVRHILESVYNMPLVNY